MRRLALLVLVATAAACATFRPVSMMGAIRPLSGPEGACTAWAVGPSKWITAAHCADGVDTLDGQRIEWLAIDVAADLALLKGPPSERVFRLATSEPTLGDPLHVFGYGLNRPTLLMLPGVYIAARSDFFQSGSAEMLMGIANGMPGMSGGPILWKGRVVSVITGGGPPMSHANKIGTGVPWRLLRAFVARTGADTY